MTCHNDKCYIPNFVIDSFTLYLEMLEVNLNANKDGFNSLLKRIRSTSPMFSKPTTAGDHTYQTVGTWIRNSEYIAYYAAGLGDMQYMKAGSWDVTSAPVDFDKWAGIFAYNSKHSCSNDLFGPEDVASI